jgi:hypothetical protein
MGGGGLELMDLCVRCWTAIRAACWSATFCLVELLESALVTDPRAGRTSCRWSRATVPGSHVPARPRGAGVYRAERVVDLPGT